MNLGKRRIVIIGDSHVDAIKGAIRAGAAADLDADIVALRLMRMKNGKEVGDILLDKVDELGARLTPRDTLVTAVGGHEHVVLGLVQSEQPFDFHSRELPDLGILPGAELIPYRALRDWFDLRLRRKDSPRMKILTRTPGVRRLHLLPPPPKADTAHLLARHEAVFAQAGLAERGISPAPLRLKLWALQSEVVRALSAEWGVEPVAPPAGALTADGFLEPALYAPDATHANSDYGALVIRQLIELGAHSPQPSVES